MTILPRRGIIVSEVNVKSQLRLLEVRREVDVLTAEGRISAWVLGAMPIFLLVALQTLNPGYAKPLFEGAGLFALAFTAVSICIGVGIIFKMVKIEV